MKRSGWAALLLCAVMLCACAGRALAAEEAPVLDNTTFKSYVLCDNASGQVVAEYNSGEAVKNVGLSQMMSILLFLEAIDSGELMLDDPVTISRNASQQGGSTVFLEYGDTYTVETLLKGVIVVAANDACVALCERVAGSVEDFVDMMNARAAGLGMVNTCYTDPTGYVATGEYTTAQDLALLSRKLVTYPLLFEYSGIWQDSINHGEGRATDIVNANRVVKLNDKCDGIAVGSSKETGYSIAATAQQGDSRFLFIGVGASSPGNRFNATSAALDFAFNAYTSKTFVTAGQIVKKDYVVEGGSKNGVALYAAGDISLMLKKGDEAACEQVMMLDENVALPLKEGDKVGSIAVTLNGEELARTDVIVGGDIEELTYAHALHRVIQNWIY